MHPKLKQAFKFTGRFILAILIFLGTYLLAVLVFSHITVNRHPEQGGDVTVYIKSNGVHTDIVVPLKNDVKDWTTDILFSHTKANDTIANYVGFGWGDKGFYLNTPEWSDLKASTAFKAAFWLGTTAMHTKFYKALKESGSCKKIVITRDDYTALVKYIQDSFDVDSKGHVIWIENQSYGQTDAFYEAQNTYSLFYTCNTWANSALKAANQKAALWTPYEGGIFCHYKE
jgi:uncharacterized protein (TIGR02117 family)